MKNEKYWEMALDKTRISIKENSLFPLKTQDKTKDIYGKMTFSSEDLIQQNSNPNSLLVLR